MMYSEVKVGGLSLAYSHPHDVGAMIEVLVMDVYVKRNLRPGDVVVDVGSGIGEFSLLAASVVGPSGLVISIEPNPVDFQVLQRNIVTNRAKNVLAFNCAVGPRTGLVTLGFKGHTWTVEMVQLGALLTNLQDRFPSRSVKPTFLKLDIEGAEPAVLSDLGQLMDSVRTIAIELHGTKPEVDAILKPVGFRFSRITRSQYMARTARFLVRHPAEAFNLWTLFRKSGDYPGVRRMLAGAQIARSATLMVGVYKRG